MHRFDRMHLSAEVAMRYLDTIDLEEKTRLAEGISLIAVIDHRRDYLAAGYASMFSYCTGRLHMSEDRAVRRIEVARLTLKVPEVLDHLADGRLSVTTACVLAPHLTPETAADLLAASAFRSRQEIVRLLAERSHPAADGALALDGPTQVEDSSSLSAPVRIDSLAGPCASGERVPNTDPPAAAQTNPPRRGHVRASAGGGYDVRLSITDEEHGILRRATDLLGHAVPSGDPALVYARAMEHYVAHLEKRRFGVKRGAERSPDSPAPGRVDAPRSGRRMSRRLRRRVWERDGGSCAFVSGDGHRCGSTTRLEVDHVTPVALGGRTEPENLRLLCRAHNQYEAERVLGKGHVQAQRELTQRERTRAKVAAHACATRARATATAENEQNHGQAAAEVALPHDKPDASVEKPLLGAATEVSQARANGAVEEAAARTSSRDAEDAKASRDEGAEMQPVANQARNDDLRAALRGLGFTFAQAKWGVEMADAMPAASLETCLRHALTQLTRSIAIRGQRRARCSA